MIGAAGGTDLEGEHGEHAAEHGHNAVEQDSSRTVCMTWMEWLGTISYATASGENNVGGGVGVEDVYSVFTRKMPMPPMHPTRICRGKI